MIELSKEQQKINRGLWADALESGEYAQTKGALEINEARHDAAYPPGFCCLGVLAKISGAERVVDEYNYTTYDGQAATLPLKAMQWVGLQDSAGTYSLGNKCLAQDNDVGGKTFAEIAAIIRSEPDGLFND